MSKKTSTVGQIFDEALRQSSDLSQKLPMSTLRDIDRLAEILREVAVSAEIKSWAVLCLVDFFRGIPERTEN